MNRRSFTKKAMVASASLTLGGIALSNAFSKLSTESNFNFMSQNHPNKILIDKFFKAYSENNLEGIHAVLNKDIKWHIPGEHPLSGTKNGINEVLKFFKKLRKGSFRAEPIIMGVNDNYVIDCHKNWSNVEEFENLNSMSCLLWRIENNKIVEVHNFPEDQKVVNAFFNKLYS